MSPKVTSDPSVSHGPSPDDPESFRPACEEPPTRGVVEIPVSGLTLTARGLLAHLQLNPELSAADVSAPDDNLWDAIEELARAGLLSEGRLTENGRVTEGGQR